MSIIVGIGLLNLLAQPEITFTYIVVFSVISILFAVTVGYVAYKFFHGLGLSYKLTIDDYKLTLTYGRLTQHTVVIQKAKLKHHTTRSSVIERNLNAATLQLFSSGSKHPDMTIPCLPNEVLQSITSLALPNMHKDNETLHGSHAVS